MKSISANRILRTVIVAITFTGWFVLSNHCALGRLVQSARAEKEHACCHNGESKPEKEPAGGRQGAECCKSLHAIVPDGLKAADIATPTFVVAMLSSRLTLEARFGAPVVIACDTGPPPGVATFSELVLQRSLRSHAPPFLA